MVASRDSFQEAISYSLISDKRWRMFSKMFMMNMLLKMIIYAKVCIIFLNQNDTKKILARFDI